jgi:hypothetical protein
MSVNVVEHTGPKHSIYVNPEFDVTSCNNNNESNEEDIHQVLAYIKNTTWCKHICKLIEKTSFQMITYNEEDIKLVMNTLSMVINKKGDDEITKEVQYWLSFTNDIGQMYAEAINSARLHAMNDSLEIFRQKVMMFTYVTRAPLRAMQQ